MPRVISDRSLQSKISIMNDSISSHSTLNGVPPAPGSEGKLDRLKTLLREMFQLDRGDLDFGLYRIMNLKTAEIAAFLDNDLLPQVQEQAQSHECNQERVSLEKGTGQDAREQLPERGVIDPDTSPIAQDYRSEPKACRDAKRRGC